VFLGLLPLVAVTGSFALPALFRLGKQPRASGSAASGADTEHRLTDGLAAAAGAGLILAGLTLAAGSDQVLGGIGLLGLGIALIAPSLRRLLPAGTFTARPGLSAVILCRGLLTFTFFGADAYVTLTITTVRHHTPALAGVAVTGATVAWTVAGFGIGLAYAPISLLMLREAPSGREGWASASLSLADVLGTALGIGAGGAAVAAAAARGWPLAAGVGIAFAIAGTGAVALAVASRRLPLTRSAASPDPRMSVSVLSGEADVQDEVTEPQVE
jgi:hypothetical protein